MCELILKVTGALTVLEPQSATSLIPYMEASCSGKQSDHLLVQQLQSQPSVSPASSCFETRIGLEGMSKREGS